MKIAVVGLGEAAAALITGWGPARAGQITAYDIKLDVPETAVEIRGRASSLGIRCCDRIGEALRDAGLVFSTVTADQALAAAQAGAPHLAPQSMWCDLNSCAPSVKRRAAEEIAGAGGRYLDVAVMSPVHPDLNMVPLLVSGNHAKDIAPVLEALPMSLRVVEGDVGRASAIKMVRSVLVKGLEALTAECTLAAVAAGVEDEVLPSLKHGHPRLDVAKRAAYNFERCLRHGERRAAEMDEVAAMLAELGLPNAMSAATAGWQRRIAMSDVRLPGGQEPCEYRALAEALLKAVRQD